MAEYMQELFDFMEQEHHLTLTDGELYDLIHAVQNHLESEGKEVVDGERLNELALAADWCPPPQAEDKSKRPVKCQENDGAMPDVCISCWKAYIRREEDSSCTSGG